MTLAEQRRIVAKVEQLMALVDASETQLIRPSTHSPYVRRTDGLLPLEHAETNG